MMSARRPEYVVNAIDNPEMMAVCYAQGWCKSPDGITAEEAAIADTTGVNFHGIPIVDLRYFENIATGIAVWNFGDTDLVVLPQTILLPNNMTFRLNRERGITIIVPNNCSWATLNDGYCRNATIVFENTTPPPAMRNAARIFNLQLVDGKPAYKVYVPDIAVDAYKAHIPASADVIHPISEYDGAYKQYIHLEL